MNMATSELALYSEDYSLTFDWRSTDPKKYEPIFAERVRRLKNIRSSADPDAIWKGLKLFYKDNPIQFINDWGITTDPRNLEVGLPVVMPFIMFPRQQDFIMWLLARWRNREDGLVEKSRDMGVSWLCCGFAVWMWSFHGGSVIGFGSRKEEYVDKAGDPKSLFWKIREYIRYLPSELRPDGYKEAMDAPSMRVLNRENSASIVGEAGDNIGRGNRTSIYFKDESAFYERADAIDSALSQTSNVKIDVSTVNGPGNAFYRKRHSGAIPVFIFDWRDDPRKDEAWYARQCEINDKKIVAREIDRDYSASIEDAYIPADIVQSAMSRGPAEVRGMGGLKVGVDVARFGSNKTVVTFRRGRLVIKQVSFGQMDLVSCASRVHAEISGFGEKPEQIAVDTTGLGAGVADMLRKKYPDIIDENDLKRYRIVVDVEGGNRMNTGRHYNLRAYMYAELKEWLQSHCSIPNDDALLIDLTAIRYSFKGNELLLESKADMLSRGIQSPDKGDSLALTFAIPSEPPPDRFKKLPKVEAYNPSDRSMGM